MTKQNAIEAFKSGYHDFRTTYRNDHVAICEDWNNWTDMLCQDGEITEAQYNNWTNPF